MTGHFGQVSRNQHVHSFTIFLSSMSYKVQKYMPSPWAKYECVYIYAIWNIIIILLRGCCNSTVLYTLWTITYTKTRSKRRHLCLNIIANKVQKNLKPSVWANKYVIINYE